MTDFKTAYLAAKTSEQRKVALYLDYVDINDGYLHDAVLFSQIMYWHTPSKKNNLSKLRVKYTGHDWIAKHHADWYDECRIKAPMVRKALKRMQERNLICCDVTGFGGKKTPLVRINWEGFQAAITSQYDTLYQTNMIQCNESNTETTSTETTKEKDSSTAENAVDNAPGDDDPYRKLTSDELSVAINNIGSSLADGIMDNLLPSDDVDSNEQPAQVEPYFTCSDCKKSTPNTSDNFVEVNLCSVCMKNHPEYCGDGTMQNAPVCDCDICTGKADTICCAFELQSINRCGCCGDGKSDCVHYSGVCMWDGLMGCYHGSECATCDYFDTTQKSDNAPELTTEQADVLSIINHKPLSETSHALKTKSVEIALDDLIGFGYVVSDDDMTNYIPTDAGRAALKVHQDSSKPKVADLVVKPTIQEVDATIYGSRDEPVKRDSDIAALCEVSTGDDATHDIRCSGCGKVMNTEPCSNVCNPKTGVHAISAVLIICNECNSPPAPKAKKARKAKAPKQTPEQKQVEANMFEAVKFTWRIDDNANYKIIKLKQWFLGTIKKSSKKYGVTFRINQLDKIPANALEVVAFGFWYRTEYDDVTLPEQGSKLRSQFETFRGSGQRYDAFIRKAINIIQEKSLKIVIPGDDPPPEAETEEEQEMITPEQQQEAKDIMKGLEDKFSSYGGGE